MRYLEEQLIHSFNSPFMKCRNELRNCFKKFCLNGLFVPPTLSSVHSLHPTHLMMCIFIFAAFISEVRRLTGGIEEKRCQRKREARERRKKESKTAKKRDCKAEEGAGEYLKNAASGAKY